jgi:cell growth-regulating nucleolar protein
VNVFDFLLPNHGDDEWESDEDDMHAEYPPQPAYVTRGYGYGAGPVPVSSERFNSMHNINASLNGHFETPDPRRSHARKISTDSTGQKKSGKRKRGQPEDLDLSKINTDIVMTDVPPTSHTGLTGGLNRLMTTTLPPSPDESPNSPIKRSRRDSKDRKDKKEARRKISDSSDKADRKRTKPSHPAPTTTKHPVSKHTTSTTTTSSKHAPPLKKRPIHKRSPSPSQSPPHSPSRKKPALKAIEYPTKPAAKTDDSMALVRISHAPTTKPVASFLDCLARGTDTDEGVSVWRALKRWRRDGGKESGEKELWKGIKIRMNDRGELIVCV